MESQTIKNPIPQQLFSDFIIPEDCKTGPTFECKTEPIYECNTEHSPKKNLDITKEVKCVQVKEESNIFKKPYSPAIKKPKLKTSDIKRPEYSYVALIYCALRQAPERRLQLNQIYQWIAKNYPYYKMTEKAWQNSIRHNLSLNECFLKTPNEAAKTGERKGNFWTLVDGADDMFKDGSWKRRKNTRKGMKTSKKNSQTANDAINHYTNYANFASSVTSNVSLVPSTNYYLNSVHGVPSVAPTRSYYATPNMFSSSAENIDYTYNSIPQHSSTFASQFAGTQNYFDGTSYATSSGEQRSPAPQLQHSSQSMQHYYNSLNFYVSGSAATSTQPSEESRSPVSQNNAQNMQSMCNAYNNLSSAQFAASRIDYSTVAQEYGSGNYCSIDSNTCYPYTTSMYASL